MSGMSQAQFAALMPVEQVDQAVVVLRDEERDAVRQRSDRSSRQRICEALGDRGELARELVEVEVEVGEVPLDAHEEQAALGVLVLVGVQDVGVVAVEELADGGDDPLAVGAVDEQDGGVLHRRCTHSALGLRRPRHRTAPGTFFDLALASAAGLGDNTGWQPETYPPETNRGRT